MKWRIASIAIVWLCGGCNVGLHPIPANAVSSEQRAVRLLKPLSERVSWDSSGHVREIALVGENVHDEHVAALGDLKQLETLSLHSWSISDDCMRDVMKLPNLTALDIQFTLISDAGCRHLAGCPALRLIVIDGTPITDEGLAHLARIPTLCQVFAEQTKFTKEGIANFVDGRDDRSIQFDSSYRKSLRDDPGKSAAKRSTETATR